MADNCSSDRTVGKEQRTERAKKVKRKRQELASFESNWRMIERVTERLVERRAFN